MTSPKNHLANNHWVVTLDIRKPLTQSCVEGFADFFKGLSSLSLVQVVIVGLVLSSFMTFLTSVGLRYRGAESVQVAETPTLSPPAQAPVDTSKEQKTAVLLAMAPVVTPHAASQAVKAPTEKASAVKSVEAPAKKSRPRHRQRAALRTGSKKPSRGFSPALPLSSNKLLLVPVKTGYVSSRFGWRKGRRHSGTDFAAPYGSPIYASSAGRVVFSGWEGGYGKMVLIDHGNGLKTRYGHCSNLEATVGEVVEKGQVIAYVGSTGHSTGPHLHYEVIAHNVHRNPETYLDR